MSELVCPSCGEWLTATAPPQTNALPVRANSNLWVVLLCLSFACSLVALSLSFVRTSGFKTDVADLASTDPKETARRNFELHLGHALDIRLGLGTCDYEDIYERKHKGEILKTFEIADVQTNGKAAIVFERYSVGSLVFRKTEWLWQNDGKWYTTYFLYLYLYDYREDAANKSKVWFQEMDDRKTKWEKDSATVYQE